MVDVPLPDGRKFRGKINGLDSWARHHPSQFPGSNGTGHDVLMAALGTLLNLKINYYAAVDLQGFANVVNELGGVDVNVAHSFCDPTYDQYGYLNGFAITAGRHHLNGLQALAYARVRKALGESDFTRAARQQELLNGLRDRIVRGGFLSDPVGLFRIGQTIQTNVPRRSILPDPADDMTHIGRSQTYRAVVGHLLVAPGYDVRGSIQIPISGRFGPPPRCSRRRVEAEHEVCGASTLVGRWRLGAFELRAGKPKSTPDRRLPTRKPRRSRRRSRRRRAPH
jgi:LCP family protein required for cell wall assembly